MEREILEDCIARVAPEEYRGDWDCYDDACKAAANRMRELLAEIRTEGDTHKRLMDALKEVLPIRNEFPSRKTGGIMARWDESDDGR